jgi:hypothetical protein
MKAIMDRDGTTVSDDWRPQPPIDLPIRSRPRIRKGWISHVLWNGWCDAAIAAVVWLTLLVLALFALSVAARHPSVVSRPGAAATVQ